MMTVRNNVFWNNNSPQMIMFKHRINRFFISVNTEIPTNLRKYVNSEYYLFWHTQLENENYLQILRVN